MSIFIVSQWRTIRFVMVIALAATSFARAETFDASVDALESAVQKEAAEKKTEAQGGREQYYQSGMLLSRIRTVLNQDNGQEIDESLNQISVYYQSEAVKKVVAQLRKEVAADQAEKEKARLDEMRAAVESARKAVKTAKKAADLDAALEKFNGVRNRSEYRMTDQIREETNKAQQARQFVLNWQNYLMATETGDVPNARSNLQNVSNMEEGLLPRSEILERLSKIPDEDRQRNTQVEPSKLTEIVGKEISLQKVPQTMAALRKFLRDNRGYYGSLTEFETLQEELAQLQMTYDRFRSGLPSTFKLSIGSGSEAYSRVQALILPAKIELMRIVFPVYLGVPGEPKKDETIQAYLDRVMAEATLKLDASTMEKVLDLQMGLEMNSSGRQPRSSFQALVIARNQEEAGQYALAVLSYQAALKNGGDVIPAKVVGERLKAIQGAHPEEYKTAMDKALDGKTAPTYSSSRSYNGTVVIPGMRAEASRE